LLDAVVSLPDSSRYAVLLCVYDQIDDGYIAELLPMAKGLDVRIARDLSPEEFCGALSLCDLYVRATDRDGDAVAVREAKQFGLKVLASDCVTRPSGVAIFSTGDAESLRQGIVDAFSQRGLHCRSAKPASNGARQLEAVYRALLDTPTSRP
jgi:glycosyltransferase involved in cell wall biosynthesis